MGTNGRLNGNRNYKKKKSGIHIINKQKIVRIYMVDKELSIFHTMYVWYSIIYIYNFYIYLLFYTMVRVMMLKINRLSIFSLSGACQTGYRQKNKINQIHWELKKNNHSK
jgi:hypothetical protein